MVTQLSLKGLYIETIFSTSDSPSPTFNCLRVRHGLDRLSARKALDGERHVSEETAIKLCAYANVLEHNVKKRKRNKIYKT